VKCRWGAPRRRRRRPRPRGTRRQLRGEDGKRNVSVGVTRCGNHLVTSALRSRRASTVSTSRSHETRIARRCFREPTTSVAFFDAVQTPTLDDSVLYRRWAISVGGCLEIGKTHPRTSARDAWTCGMRPLRGHHPRGAGSVHFPKPWSLARARETWEWHAEAVTIGQEADQSSK
jgi:hypothetical protein